MRVIVALAVILVAGLVIGLSCDKATEPVEPEKPEDYVVYFLDGQGYKYFGYHTETHQVDSFDLPVPYPAWPAVSADGRLLYFPRPPDVLVFDVQTRQTIGRLPSYGPLVTVSPDNQYVALTGDSLLIYTTADHALVFSDSSMLHRGVFSRNSKRFYSYGVESQRGCYIYRVDLAANNEVTKIFMSDGYGMDHVLPSPDESSIYLYRHGSLNVHWLDIYDVDADSTIFIELLLPGEGWMQLSRDGKRLFISNPGGDLIGDPSPYSLAIYHIDDGHMDTLFIASKCGSPYAHTCKELVITPDGKYLIASDRNSPFKLLVYNVNRMEADTSLCIGYDKWYRALTTQKWP